MCKMPLGLWAGELPMMPLLVTHSVAPHQKRENPVLHAPLILNNWGGGWWGEGAIVIWQKASFENSLAKGSFTILLSVYITS